MEELYVRTKELDMEELYVYMRQRDLYMHADLKRREREGTDELGVARNWLHCTHLRRLI